MDIDDLTIPMDLPEDVKKWKRADVQSFLKANKGVIDLDNDNIEVFEKNKVGGAALLNLVYTELVEKPFGLPGGSAKSITYLVEELKKVKGLAATAFQAGNDF